MCVRFFVCLFVFPGLYECMNVKLICQDGTNPVLAGVRAGAAHVQIFQPWFVMFSLASSAVS